MPNWVTNEITSPDLDKIKELMEGAEEGFDFNRIVPMPEKVAATDGDYSISPGWYEWSIQNWGTKWNACDAEVTEDAIYFDTAWSTPAPVIKALSEKLGIEVSVRYADEDTGNNVGAYTFKNGEETDFDELSNTKDGYELCFELKGGEDYYRLTEDGSTYEYHDPDDEEDEEVNEVPDAENPFND